MKINNCIKNLLKLIDVLQNNSLNMTSCDAKCTKPFLGPSISATCYNTRVITLYNKQGALFNVDYSDNGVINNSSTFRVQNVKDNCCTLLILSNNGDEYVSTRQTVTVNLDCICAVKCLEDVIVNNI